MRHALPLIGFAGCLAYGSPAVGQGTFVNLDFESPILPLVPDGAGFVALADALPGWSGYIDGYQPTVVRYDGISLGSAEISFHGPGSYLSPYHGDYCVFLQGGAGPFGGVAYSTIIQTGQVPESAQSLRFHADNLMLRIVSFDAVELPVLNLSGGIFGYQEYGVDVSMLAVRTGELRFTGGSGLLDYIQFSPVPIPEPSVLGLLGLGVLIFCRRTLAGRAL